MTAFTPAQIPPSVDTFEKLNAWSSMVLNIINPDLEAIEGPGSPVKSSQFGIFKIDQTGNTNAFSRQSFQLQDDFAYYIEITQKLQITVRLELGSMLGTVLLANLLLTSIVFGEVLKQM